MSDNPTREHLATLLADALPFVRHCIITMEGTARGNLAKNLAAQIKETLEKHPEPLVDK